MLWLIGLAAFGWLGLLLVPWQPWRMRENLEPPESGNDSDLSVTVLIPARDEAAVIGRTLRALRGEGNGVRVVLIDDQSTDETVARAREEFGDGIEIIAGELLPAGWAGKLWALEQGRQHALTDLILLLDADIELKPGMVAALVGKLSAERLDLVSIMAELRMQTFWEKLLVPAFVYFFKLLYPFSLANDQRSRRSAAAGGCILVRTGMIETIGGFAAVRGAIIDDCALAAKVKASGGRTWIGLSRSVRSHRAYPTLSSLWNMVARSAFPQLHYSTWLLWLTTVAMLWFFWMPLAGLFAPALPARALALAGAGAMCAAYVPTLRYYDRSPLWALALPPIGTLFLLMTWSSAIRHWWGRGSEWKGRIYRQTSTARRLDRV